MQYLKNKMEPAIYSSMKSKGFPLVPYVNHWGHTPDKGWPQFYEPPRFASGFANLFQTFAFVSEDILLNTSLTGQKINQSDQEEIGDNALSNKRDMWDTDGWLK